MPVAGNREKHIRVIKKAFDILELFLFDNKPLSLTEISQKLSLPKTTAIGILQTLTGLNALEFDLQTTKYRLGPVLFHLGMHFISNIDFVALAKVWMERLCLMFQQTVNVGILHNHKVITLVQAEPGREDLISLPLEGTTLPAHTSSIGKMFLAFMNEASRNILLKDYQFSPLTPRSISSRERLDRELEEISQKRISFDEEESVSGVSSIGSALFNSVNQIIIGFSITGKAESINHQRDKIVKEVLYTSEKVSALFGYSH